MPAEIHPKGQWLYDGWYVALPSAQLAGAPVPVCVADTPIVLFRDASGYPQTLIDRCSHRNVPLSLGRVEGGELECRYHGWRFDGSGACVGVPGLVRTSGATGRGVSRFATREQDGWVWVYGTPDVEPASAPFRFPHLDEPGYTTIRQVLDFEADLASVAENALDVPHTAFLHRGLFRGHGQTNEIEVVVRHHGDRIEAEYLGEPRPAGLIGRLLAPQGGVVEHFDRFILPCIAQVEYRLGERAHLVTTTALTPLGPHRTRLFGASSFRLPMPGATVLGRALEPIALRILRQDAVVLKAQTENVRRFGGERFVSTELDTLGPGIRALLRHAAEGRARPTAEPRVRRLTMRV